MPLEPSSSQIIGLDPEADPGKEEFEVQEWGYLVELEQGLEGVVELE